MWCFWVFHVPRWRQDGVLGTNISPSKTDHGPPVSRNNLSISCEDNKKFMEVHVTAPRQNNAFLTENRPSLTWDKLSNFVLKTIAWFPLLIPVKFWAKIVRLCCTKITSNNCPQWLEFAWDPQWLGLCELEQISQNSRKKTGFTTYRTMS